MTPSDDFPDDPEHKAGADEGDWISSEPPVDDFGDDAAAEAATVSEGEETAAHEPAAEPVAEEKQKFPFLLLLGAVGSLAVVGGLAYWHFGGHRQESPSILDMAAQNSLKEAVPNFAAKPAASAETAAEVAPKTAYSAPSATPETPKEVKKPARQAEAPPAAEPPKETVAVISEPAPPLPAPVAAPASPPVDERLTALSTRIDDMQKALQQATLQLGQIAEKLAAAPQPAPAASPPTPAASPPMLVASQPNPAMQERLDKLEQKLLQIEQEKAAPPTAPAHQAAVDKVIPPQTMKKPRREVAHNAARHKTKAKPKPKHVAAAPNAWVLRAARPDEAWIARGTETRALQPVHVGDDLIGIGKVTAIQQVGDAWVVQGTHGTIR
jgi:hypothetical protein